MSFDAPKLDWLERYKRMYQAYDTAMRVVFFHELEKEGKEAALSLLIKIHEEVSASLGRKLCDKYAFSPDIKGALELMWTYSCEVWGFGMDDSVDLKMEGNTKGVFENKICHYWETWLKHNRALPCDENCIHEYASLIHTLNPLYKIDMTKSFPRGDDCCRFVVELHHGSHGWP